ncbi:MAG: 50S ribosomal protein L29 [Candidatus Aenigmarchaeota archaeon]|nr:50S ribosomal protein L29 [Candidatus Aenigmarchaeota archaeon]
MTILKIKKVREMKDEERSEKSRELRLEIAKEIAAAEVGGNIKNPGNIRAMKKSIARILTVQHEKKDGESK